MTIRSCPLAFTLGALAVLSPAAGMARSNELPVSYKGLPRGKARSTSVTKSLEPARRPVRQIVRQALREVDFATLQRGVMIEGVLLVGQQYKRHGRPNHKDRSIFAVTLPTKGEARGGLFIREYSQRQPYLTKPVSSWSDLSVKLRRTIIQRRSEPHRLIVNGFGKTGLSRPTKVDLLDLQNAGSSAAARTSEALRPLRRAVLSLRGEAVGPGGSVQAKGAVNDVINALKATFLPE